MCGDVAECEQQPEKRAHRLEALRYTALVDFRQAVDYLSSLQRFGVRPGLGRMRAVLSRLNDPQDRWSSIHVTGTNGKGSVTAFCASILGAAGLRVGRYHSPYVFDLCERILVDGEMIPRQRFASIMRRVVPLCEELGDTDLGPVTEFELKTIVAFKFFAEEAVDCAVVEVGMGGRLDATNVILPRVAAVTNVGLDHTPILGETVEQIAREKGGIIKPGVRFVTAAQDPAALEVLSAISREMMAGITHVRHASTRPMVYGRSVVWWEDGGELHVRTPRMYLKGLRVKMLGTHQRENAALAIAITESFADSWGFDIPEEAYAEAVATTEMPGRMQVVAQKPTILLDGAHNRDAAAALRPAALALAGAGKLHVVLGMTKGHDPRRFLAAMAPVPGRLILTQPQDERRLPLESLCEAAEDLGLDFLRAESALEGVKLAKGEAQAEDTILVTGSFYLVGDCAPLLKSRGRQRSPSSGA